jgi:hypothetical protein
VPAGAVAGIGVDEQGRPVGYLRVCEDRIDGATLYHDEDDYLGTWSATSPVTDFASWSLAEPGDGWVTEVPLGRLTTNVEYSMYGWTEDNSRSAESVAFTLGALADLEPGQVLYWSGETNKAMTEDILTVASEEDFRGNASDILD